MAESFKRLKSEMEEISEEQKNIREGQRQVKEKFGIIESECEELKRETKLIIQQSARTQVKLALMFRILKAREAGELNLLRNKSVTIKRVLLSTATYISYLLRFMFEVKSKLVIVMLNIYLKLPTLCIVLFALFLYIALISSVCN
ncbi:hypothetical protein GOBAR_AA25412 [Gossypium barbadense]|uniref:Uncharacterized protein n=1 Tax=Gossypium barbadense TaxID=3634 RepID=A0A2P5WVZ3_GOSBA|nr:hypothetical protein GOBAR_AA25412 [Gossypium barbadense]